MLPVLTAVLTATAFPAAGKQASVRQRPEAETTCGGAVQQCPLASQRRTVLPRPRPGRTRRTPCSVEPARHGRTNAA